MRFFLVDRITSLEVGKTARGCKCWSLSDPFFADHFPGFPVVPGVYLIESMAQLLGMLIERSFGPAFPERTQGVFPMLGQVDETRFHQMVLPGDKAEMTASLDSLDLYRARGQVQMSVDGEMRARSTLTYLLLDRSRIGNEALERQRETYYGELTRAFQRDVGAR